MSSCPAGRKPPAGGMKRPRRFPGRRAAPGPAYGENSRGAPAASAIGAPEMRRVGGGGIQGFERTAGALMAAFLCAWSCVGGGGRQPGGTRAFQSEKSSSVNHSRPTPCDPSTGSGQRKLRDRRPKVLPPITKFVELACVEPVETSKRTPRSPEPSSPPRRPFDRLRVLLPGGPGVALLCLHLLSLQRRERVIRAHHAEGPARGRTHVLGY